MNHNAIDRGFQDVKEFKVPDSWKTAADTDLSAAATGDRKDLVDFVNDILIPVNAQQRQRPAGFRL